METRIGVRANDQRKKVTHAKRVDQEKGRERKGGEKESDLSRDVRRAAGKECKRFYLTLRNETAPSLYGNIIWKSSMKTDGKGGVV